MNYYGYHDMSSATYQNYFKTLGDQGFRVISLSIHGDVTEPRYTAVWAQYNAGAWVGNHDVRIENFQTIFDSHKNKGFTPMIVTAIGDLTDSVFGIIFEKGNFGSWKAKHGMSETEFDNENKSALSSGLMLKSYTIYGKTSKKVFAAIWHQNPNWFKSHLYLYKTLSEYQPVFNSETKLNLYRPSIVAISPDKKYGVHFTDNVVGQWVSKHNLDKNQYQNLFNECKNMGLIPICVDAIGKGDSARYSAIFAKSHIPEEKQWQVFGTGTTILKKLDSIAEDFMRSNVVRAMQISISKNGHNYYNKAFNLSESIYRKANTNTRFLLASCSKMFVCACIERLFDSGSLQRNDKVYAILSGFSSPIDRRSDDITIQQLIDMQSGYRRMDDCTYNMRTIGQNLSPQRTVSKLDLANFMYKSVSLNYTPGRIPMGVDGYCNYNYVLLSMVVEKLTGQDYFTYLYNTILKPDNIFDAKPWVTNKTPRDADEIFQEDQYLHESAINVNNKDLVPDIYGGDGMVKEVAIGSCSIASTAFAMTQFIRLHAVVGNGLRQVNERTGSTPGATAYAQSRADDIDWAITINTREFKNGTALSSLKTSINAVLDSKSSSLKTLRIPGGRTGR